MRRLRLIGLSADGRNVVCVADDGTEFALPADDRLRAALRGDRARLGQLEIEMDSALRPRDIQARIRSGESPEAVASLAGVSVDKIMPFCVPVIAERQHVAETARRSHVRRKNTEGPARRLGDVVAERLHGRGLEPESAEWDAWRRDDGRWTVRATYHSGERERAGTFVFDLAGRYSAADDDEARWLTGEKQSSSHGPQPREGGRGSERRLSAVPDGDDLLSMSEEDVTEGSVEGDVEGDDLDAVVRAVQDQEPADRGARTPPAEATDSPDTDVTAGAASASDDEVGDAAEARSPATDSPAQSDTEAPPRKRRQRRASVPSWDEIMFGKDSSSE